MMYYTSVFHKSGKEWASEGSATFYALQLDYFRTPMGDIMLQLPSWMLSMLTICVWYWEWLAPGLFFFPIATGLMRTVSVFGFMFMHLNFALCLRLGTFFWISEAGLLALLPSWFWDTLIFGYLGVKQPNRTNFELFYKKGGLFNFWERFVKCFGTFFLLPEVDIRPMNQFSSVNSDLDQERGLYHGGVIHTILFTMITFRNIF